MCFPVGHGHTRHHLASSQAAGDLSVIAIFALKLLTLSVLFGAAKAPGNELNLHAPTPGPRATKCYNSGPEYSGPPVP